MDDDVGPELSTEFEFHERSDVRHDDGDGDAEVAAVVGHRQRVVTGTRRYHPASLLRLHAHSSQRTCAENCNNVGV